MIIKSGDIEVIMDTPLFSGVNLWYPGYADKRSFQIKNRGSKSKQVQIETLGENETNNLSQGINIKVLKEANCVYGCNEIKSLRNFWEAGNMSIGEVPADDNGKMFTLEIVMPLSAEDKYQGGRAVFDLRIGFEGDTESTVLVQSDSGISVLTTTPTSISAPAILSDANDTNIEEAMPITAPTVTGTKTEVSGTVMGETVRNGGVNNWWRDWWWLILLLILTGLAWWWNGRRKD